MSRRLKPANNWGKAWNVLLRSAVLFLFLGCGHAFADLSPDTYGCACSGDHSGLGSEEDVPTGSGSATADSDLEPEEDSASNSGRPKYPNKKETKPE